MDKALNYLALARKGGMAELGEEPVGGAARAGKAYAILVASDASDHTWRRAKSFAAGTEQQCVRLPYTKDQLGETIGRDSLAMAAITDVSLALARNAHTRDIQECRNQDAHSIFRIASCRLTSPLRRRYLRRLCIRLWPCLCPSFLLPKVPGFLCGLSPVFYGRHSSIVRISRRYHL